MPETSIILTAEDRVSSKLKSLSQNTKYFNKDLDALVTDVKKTGKQIDGLTDDLSQQKTAMVNTKKMVADARKEFHKYGTEVSKVKLEKATQKQEKLTQSINATKKAIRDSEKQMYRYADTATKKTAQAGKGFSGLMSQVRNGEGMMGGLFAAGAGLMVGNALQQAGNVTAGSMLGSHGGTMFGSVLGGATTGAAMGMALGPQAAGIGAAIGAGAGLVQGVAQVGQEKDEAFKSYVQDAYQGVMNDQKQRTTSGSGTAAGREMDQIAFSTLLGGDDRASQFLADTRKFSKVTPFEYDDLTGLSKTLLAFGSSMEDIIPDLTAIGDAGSALGMNNQNMNMAATALGRMDSTDKVNLEYMNMLTERKVKAIDWLAERDNLSKATVYDRISRGQYSGHEVASFIIDEMERQYGGSMARQAKTYSGLTSTVADYKTDFAAAQGEGYNEIRKQGMQDEIADYEKMGDTIGSAYSMIGEWQGSLENKKNELERDALDTVMNGNVSVDYAGKKSGKRLLELRKDYLKASADQEAGIKDAGERMGVALAEAQVIAENEYNASDGAKLQKEGQLGLIDAIRQDTVINQEYWNAGEQFGQEMSKGLMAGMFDATKKDMTEENIRAGIPKDYAYSLASTDSILAPGYATGLSRVPYDDFPARLHEGERVLTASQARNYNSGRSGGGSPSIVIHMPGAVMRSDNDVREVAANLLEELKMADMSGVYRN